jgi:hypothetical protein
LVGGREIGGGKPIIVDHADLDGAGCWRGGSRRQWPEID